jgi:hypothetical protein
LATPQSQDDVIQELEIQHIHSSIAVKIAAGSSAQAQDAVGESLKIEDVDRRVTVNIAVRSR